MVREVVGTTAENTKRSRLVHVPTGSARIADHVAKGFAEHLLGMVDVRVAVPRPDVDTQGMVYLLGPEDLRGMLAVWESAPGN